MGLINSSREILRRHSRHCPERQFFSQTSSASDGIHKTVDQTENENYPQDKKEINKDVWNHSRHLSIDHTVLYN